MIAWALRWLTRLVGVEVVDLAVGVHTWGPDTPHRSTGRYLRLFFAARVVGRYMDVEVRL